MVVAPPLFLAAPGDAFFVAASLTQFNAAWRGFCYVTQCLEPAMTSRHICHTTLPVEQAIKLLSRHLSVSSYRPPLPTPRA